MPAKGSALWASPGERPRRTDGGWPDCTVDGDKLFGKPVPGSMAPKLAGGISRLCGDALRFGKPVVEPLTWYSGLRLS